VAAESRSSMNIIVVRRVLGLVGAVLVIAGAAGGALAQPCAGQDAYGLRGYFRLITAVAGGSGLNEAQIGGIAYGTAPVDLPLTNSNANAGGCYSTITARATSNYGNLHFTASGSAANCATNGVLMAIDQSGGGPQTDSLDRLTITSATLPQGTPANLQITWRLSGFGGVQDSVPQFGILADLNAGSQLGNYNNQLHGVGTVTCIIPAAVGLPVSVRSAMTVSMGAGSLGGATPSSATMSADLRLITTCSVLTQGAGFVSCGGGSYAPPCSADFNGDGDVGTDADIEAFFACLAGNCCANLRLGRLQRRWRHRH